MKKKMVFQIRIWMLCVVLLMGLVESAQAQRVFPELNEQQWQEIGAFQLRTQKQGLLTLTSWSAASVVSGAIAFPLTDGAQKSFHRMNLSWGLINLAIATPAWIGYVKAKRNPRDAQKIWKDYRALEKAWLFNSALDVSYMVAGGWLWESSRLRSGQQRSDFKGFGQAILMQGAFLFLYDIIYYARLQKGRKKFALK